MRGKWAFIMVLGRFSQGKVFSQPLNQNHESHILSTSSTEPGIERWIQSGIERNRCTILLGPYSEFRI